MVRRDTLVLMVLLSFLPTNSAGSTDFSGSYTLVPPKHASKAVKAISETLTVVQTANAVEVTRVLDGKSSTNKFPLDGSEGSYRTENQTPGICKGHIKGNQLILDSTIVTRPLKDGPVVMLHTKERWELSPDSKTLKIHTETENPQLDFKVFDPWTDIYTRN